VREHAVGGACAAGVCLGEERLCPQATVKGYLMLLEEGKGSWPDPFTLERGFQVPAVDWLN